jgi:hypothetical protein
MTRWLLISMIAAQLMGCEAPQSYADTQRGICKAEHKTLVETYSAFSKGTGYTCL